MPFSIIDIILFVIIFVICIRAAINGFLDEVFGLGSFVIGGYLAFFLTPCLQPHLAKSMNETLARVLSFLLLFIIVFLFMKIIQMALKSIFSGTILKSLDHCLGFGFGAIEGVFCVFLFFFLLIVLQPWFDSENFRQSSFLYRFLEDLLNSSVSKITVNA